MLKQKNLNNKIAITFDLGTTSVGYSVIDTNNQILDSGVRLFQDPNFGISSNEERRLARSRRRSINRSRIRKQDLKNLFIKYDLVDSENFEKFKKQSFYDNKLKQFLQPIEIKYQALKKQKQLTIHELIIILSNYLNHRGFTYKTDEQDLQEDQEAILNITKSNLDHKLYPCENQYNWFKQTGKVVGNPLNSQFPNKEYVKEIETILNNQKLITNKEFINEFITLFTRVREYWIGPGSEKSPTPYGLYQKDENGKIIKKGEKLWDVLIGKCTYYPDEKRNYKYSPITELFNLINDLSNLKVKNEKGEILYLTAEEKQTFLKDKTLTFKSLEKYLNSKNYIITSGLRRKDETFEIEKCNSIKKISKILTANIKDFNFDLLKDIEIIDKIFNIGVNCQNADDRKWTFLRELGDVLPCRITFEACQALALQKDLWRTGLSSLSKKAQWEYINFALDNCGKNQQYFFQELVNKNGNNTNNNFFKYKYYPINYFKDEILPIAVKRTFNQTIKVLNAIIKKYANQYQISHIFIELAREMNSLEEKSKIEQELKTNKKTLEESCKKYHITPDLLKQGNNKEKYLLWQRKNGVDQKTREQQRKVFTLTKTKWGWSINKWTFKFKSSFKW